MVGTPVLRAFSTRSLSLHGQPSRMKKNIVVEEQDLLKLLEAAGRPLHLDDILRMGSYSRRIKRGILATLQRSPTQVGTAFSYPSERISDTI